MSVLTSVIENYLKTHENTMLGFKTYLKLTEIPLAERWENYLLLERMLPIDQYGQINDLPEMKNLSDFDSMYDTDRYSTNYYSDVIDAFEELDDIEFKDVNLDNLKEQMLATGFGGYVYDWWVFSHCSC